MRHCSPPAGVGTGVNPTELGYIAGGNPRHLFLIDNYASILGTIVTTIGSTACLEPARVTQGMFVRSSVPPSSTIYFAYYNVSRPLNLVVNVTRGPGVVVCTSGSVTNPSVTRGDSDGNDGCTMPDPQGGRGMLVSGYPGANMTVFVAVFGLPGNETAFTAQDHAPCAPAVVNITALPAGSARGIDDETPANATAYSVSSPAASAAAHCYSCPPGRVLLSAAGGPLNGLCGLRCASDHYWVQGGVCFPCDDSCWGCNQSSDDRACVSCPDGSALLPAALDPTAAAAAAANTAVVSGRCVDVPDGCSAYGLGVGQLPGAPAGFQVCVPMAPQATTPTATPSPSLSATSSVSPTLSVGTTPSTTASPASATPSLSGTASGSTSLSASVSTSASATRTVSRSPSASTQASSSSAPSGSRSRSATATASPASATAAPLARGCPNNCFNHGSCRLGAIGAGTAAPVCYCDAGYLGADCGACDYGRYLLPSCSIGGVPCNLPCGVAARNDTSGTTNATLLSCVADAPGAPGHCLSGSIACTGRDAPFLPMLQCAICPGTSVSRNGCVAPGSTCSGHGVCDATGRCTCDGGWSGADCATPDADSASQLLGPCSGVNCGGRGVCVIGSGADAGAAVCACALGWFAQDCDENIMGPSSVPSASPSASSSSTSTPSASTSTLYRRRLAPSTVAASGASSAAYGTSHTSVVDGEDDALARWSRRLISHRDIPGVGTGRRAADNIVAVTSGWAAGPWSPCSEVCGAHGLMARSVACYPVVPASALISAAFVGRDVNDDVTTATAAAVGDAARAGGSNTTTVVAGPVFVLNTTAVLPNTMCNSVVAPVSSAACNRFDCGAVANGLLPAALIYFDFSALLSQSRLGRSSAARDAFGVALRREVAAALIAADAALPLDFNLTVEAANAALPVDMVWLDVDPEGSGRVMMQLLSPLVGAGLSISSAVNYSESAVALATAAFVASNAFRSAGTWLAQAGPAVTVIPEAAGTLPGVGVPPASAVDAVSASGGGTSAAAIGGGVGAAVAVLLVMLIVLLLLLRSRRRSGSKRDGVLRRRRGGGAPLASVVGGRTKGHAPNAAAWRWSKGLSAETISPTSAGPAPKAVASWRAGGGRGPPSGAAAVGAAAEATLMARHGGGSAVGSGGDHNAAAFYFANPLSSDRHVPSAAPRGSVQPVAPRPQRFEFAPSPHGAPTVASARRSRDVGALGNLPAPAAVTPGMRSAGLTPVAGAVRGPVVNVMNVAYVVTPSGSTSSPQNHHQHLLQRSPSTRSGIGGGLAPPTTSTHAVALPPWVNASSGGLAGNLHAMGPSSRSLVARGRVTATRQ